MRSLMYKYMGSWVKMSEPTSVRVAMCEIYPESAPADWLLRLQHWHIPAEVSPLHDRDTYDSDKITPVFKTDEFGDIIKEDGEPVNEIDENGEPVFKVWHKVGDIKKPHHHVMLAYGNSTTRKTFMKIIRDIGGVVPPWEHMEVCSVMSMHRYFTHKDNPEKAQYDEKDIIFMGGFDPVNYQTYADRNEPFHDVMEILEKHPEIKSYRSLCNYYRTISDNKMFYFCMNHTLAINKLIKEK